MDTSLTFTRVKLCKRVEVSGEPSDLLYGIFSVGGTQLPASCAASASSQILAQKFLDFLRPSETQFICK